MKRSISSRVFGNPRFHKMFIRYLLWVFLGITVPLLISEFAVYAFSNVRLTEKVDEAHERGLYTVQATSDSIFEEIQSNTLRFNLSNELSYLLNTKKELFPEYNFFSLSNDIKEELHLSKRGLYNNIVVYSSLNDFIFCSTYGGQQRQFYIDNKLTSTYVEYMAENPTSIKFYVVREADFSLNDRSEWTLTYYHTLSSINSSDKAFDFIAININIDKLILHLQSKTHQDSSNILIVDEANNILVDTRQEWTGENQKLIFQDSEQEKIFQQDISGAMNIQVGESNKRMNWVKSSISGWSYVQMLPYEEYMMDNSLLKEYFVVTILIGLVIAIAISFIVSYRLFAPIADIIHIMEDPHAYEQINDKSGEVQYLLINILESFQKNITLEEEMIKKIVDLRDARAKALQKQMTPHFLYNTLQAVNWLALAETKSESSKTSEAIITLSEIIRTNMEQSDNITSIEDELEYVKKFISLEQLRFGDAIQYHYDIDPWILKNKILRISIQPLVENAISHGIKTCQLEGTIKMGHIYISVKEVDKRIVVCVEDNGKGMDSGEIKQFNEVYQKEYVYANQHVGLLNLSQRIQLIYGEEWKIVLSTSQHGGLKVKFTIPFVESAPP